MSKSIRIDRDKRLKHEPRTGHNRWHPDIPAILEVEPGEEVVLETRDDGRGGVLIQVHDNGPGIAAENLAKVFTPFYTTKPQGLGLGLPLVRSIAEAHGGRIRVISNPQAGTTFVLELPAITP